MRAAGPPQGMPALPRMTDGTSYQVTSGAVPNTVDTALADWRAVFERSAATAGAAPTLARSIAFLAVSAMEGGLIQARVARSAAPLLESCAVAANAFEHLAA